MRFRLQKDGFEDRVERRIKDKEKKTKDERALEKLREKRLEKENEEQKVLDKVKEERERIEIQEREIEEKIRQKAEIERMIKDVDEEKKDINIAPPKETPKPITLSDKIDDLSQKMDVVSDKERDKTLKKFSLPGKVKRQLKKLAIKNKVMVILLCENRNALPLVAEVKRGYIFINDVPHNCSVDFMFLWKGKYPMIVLREWDIDPVGTKDYYEALDGGRNAYSHATIVRLIEESKILNKKPPMEMKYWIFIGLAVIAAAYVFLGG